MVVIIPNSDLGSLIVPPRRIVVPPIKHGGNGRRPRDVHNATRKIQKNVVQVWEITNFDRQTALFNGASMEAIT
jgi:hypothetical protein